MNNNKNKSVIQNFNFLCIKDILLQITNNKNKNKNKNEKSFGASKILVIA